MPRAVTVILVKRLCHRMYSLLAMYLAPADCSIGEFLVAFIPVVDQGCLGKHDYLPACLLLTLAQVKIVNLCSDSLVLVRVWFLA